MNNKYRLSFRAFDREFLGIDASRIDVKVLRRSKRDTNSAPQQVIELIEEYVNLLALGLDHLIEEIPKEIMDKYGVEFIQKYLDHPEEIPEKQRNTFVTDLMKIGYYNWLPTLVVIYGN